MKMSEVTVYVPALSNYFSLDVAEVVPDINGPFPYGDVRASGMTLPIAIGENFSRSA